MREAQHNFYLKKKKASSSIQQQHAQMVNFPVHASRNRFEQHEVDPNRTRKELNCPGLDYWGNL